MHIKSHHGFDRKSLNNYREKYIHHLNYWQNNRKSQLWITFENPLCLYPGKDRTDLRLLSLLGICERNKEENLCLFLFSVEMINEYQYEQS